MAANLLGDYSPESSSSAVPVYLFTITLCSPYKYIVEMKTTNSIQNSVASGLI